MTNEDLTNAIILATHAHAGQTDKAGQPYILHPLRVMLAMKTNEERIVAVLHDTLEDTDLTKKDIEDQFGRTIAEAVVSLSRNPETESYVEFIKRVDKNKIGRRVKMADIRDNMNLDRAGSLEFLAGGIGKRYANALLYLEGRSTDV